jgi:hypothetical protein
MELLHERMFQFDELLSVHLPQVHRHLEAQGVRPTMYASQWFMTLFAYRCPLDLVFRVLDMVFTEGTSIVLNAALALMKKNQATLLSLEFEGLLGYLGSGIFDVYQVTRNTNKDEWESIYIEFGYLYLYFFFFLCRTILLGL